MVSKSNIQEANKHLHAMHLHSTYLENSMRECTEIMKQNEERYCSQIQKLRQEKDDKITELTTRVKGIEEEKQILEKRLQDKEQEVRLLKGRLSVVKQIFQFLPGLKSFVGVIENARQLVKCNDTETDNIPYDLTVQSMNMSVPSLANHNLPNKKVTNLSLSEDSDSDDETSQKDNKKNLIPNGLPVIKRTSLTEKTSEVFL